MEPGLNDRESFEPLARKAAATLDAWLRQERYSMRLDHWLDGGGRDGKVAVVYLEECDGHRESRRLVLKLCPPGEDTEYEPGNNRMAWGDAPQRFSRHLLEPVGVIQVADTSWWLILQRLAAGRVRDIGTLAQVPEPRLAATYAAIVKPLLSDWAQWAHVPSMQVSDFLSRQLDKRLGPKGRVRAWASFRLELLEDPVPWIEIADEKLPNPFALVTGSSFGDIELQNVYVGRAHGDLHPGNILMPVAPNVRASQFVLVDLARYRKEAPLARDPAQLLLCLVAQHYLASSPAQRGALISLLARPDVSVGALVPPTASALVRYFWQLSRPLSERGLVDQWTEQGCLSVLACALMFLGRRGIKSADRWWFFLLAAHAAQAYIELADATKPSGPIVHVDPPDGGQQREANDTSTDLWRSAEAGNGGMLRVASGGGRGGQVGEGSGQIIYTDNRTWTDRGAPLLADGSDPSVTSRHYRIFLCHSSGDKRRVRRLYRRLRKDGFDPWLDEENIVGGQDWDAEIRKAVRSADLVIVCLSQGSVGKAGYVQREIRMVLDLADEQPGGKIFIIPTKLETCEVPDRLRRWQWVELYRPGGYERLLAALTRASSTSPS
jgi:hypothetical protein